MSRPGSIAWNASWFVAGAALAVVNTLRHRVRGYTRPRPFGPDEVERTIDYVLGVVDRWQSNGLDPQAKRILELGPGPDLGTGFVLVARGAESYTKVDRFPLAADDNTVLYAALAERLGVEIAMTQKRIHCVVSEIPMSDGIGPSFDAFVSNDALEHVADVAGTFAWLRSLGTPEAVHVHLVDPQTHMRWVRPRDQWNILRYPASIYRLMTFHGAPNRWLVSDYLAEARRSGLALPAVPGDRTDEAYVRRVRPFLARPFRERVGCDLSLLTFTLVGGTIPAAGIDCEA